MRLVRKITLLFSLLLIYSSICFGTVPELFSTAATLVDADSGYVMASKNPNGKIYPASTTKVLTSILAIENLDVDSAIVVTKSGINIPWDSSKVYLKGGEVLSVKDLLYCTLITSGNDAANMLGEAVSGSIEEFVKLMNTKAEELGCKNTHFENAHGYHDKNHYTTAEDMAIILKYAMQNEIFREICETKQYNVSKTNLSEERKLTNTNRLILSKSESVYAFPYEYALGGKTGYTGEAGRCLVGWAQKGDKNLICCVFGAPTDGKEDKRYLDTISLFEYGFNNFEHKNIIDSSDYMFDIIDKQNETKYVVGLSKDISILTAPEFEIREIGFLLDLDNSNFINKINGKQGNINMSFFVEDQNGISSNINGKFEVLEKEKYSVFNFDDLLTKILIVSSVLLLIIILIAKKSKPAKKIKKNKVKQLASTRRKSTTVGSRKTARRRVY